MSTVNVSSSNLGWASDPVHCRRSPSRLGRRDATSTTRTTEPRLGGSKAIDQSGPDECTRYVDPPRALQTSANKPLETFTLRSEGVLAKSLTTRPCPGFSGTP